MTKFERRFREPVRIDVAAVRPEGDEPVGMLESQVPRPRGAHRHAAQHDAVAVDVVVAADVLDRLEDVGLARPAIAVLDAAQRMQLDERLIDRAPANRCRPAVEPLHEPQLAGPLRLRAAVQHDIEADRLLRIVPPGNDQSVRLHRAIDSRHVAADDASPHIAPERARRIFDGQFQAIGNARDGLLNQFSIRRVAVGLVSQRPLRSLDENLDVRDSSFRKGGPIHPAHVAAWR